MAVLPTSAPNIADLLKSLGPDNRLAMASNLMTQANELIPRLPVKEANNVTHHRCTQIVGLGAASERALNEGTQPTWHKKAQHDESIALIDKWAVCDAKLADMSGNVAEFRGQEYRTSVVSVSQRAAFNVVEGNLLGTSPKQITGLHARFNALTATDANIGQQVVNCLGSTASVQTSMYLIRAGLDSVFLAYPKGSQGGLWDRDYGLVPDPSWNGVAGAHMGAYKEQVGWDIGLVVQDQRCVVRLCNIETSHFDALTSTQAPTVFSNLPHKMMVAHGKLPTDVMGRDFYVCNRSVRTGLMRLAYEKSVTGLGVREGLTQLGAPTEILTFWGIEIVLEDQITNTEAVVS
jgi:hypothetical protein